MLCCSFHDCDPGRVSMGDVGDLHHVAAFCPVLREGICAILIMIDMEDFENDDGRYLRPRTCSPERQNMSSWKLTCNSPRCKRLLV